MTKRRNKLVAFLLTVTVLLSAGQLFCTSVAETSSPYTVTFDSKGGNAVAAQTVAHGETAVEPKQPSKKGYAFDGWYTDTAFTAAYDFGSAVVSDVTVYAKWRISGATSPVFAQLQTGTSDASGSAAIRFVAAVDSLDYAQVGFVLSVSNRNPTVDGTNCTVIRTDTVWTTVYASGTAIPASALGGKYIYGLTVKGIGNGSFGTAIHVKAYALTKEGVYEYTDVKHYSVVGLMPQKPLPTIGVKEGDILKDYFALKNASTGEVLRPTTAEELQMCISYLVKGELGKANTMQNTVEAQKAQAVAAYSYVLYYCAFYGEPYPANIPTMDLTGDSVDALRDQKVYAAVGEVLGQKIVYTDTPLGDDLFCMTVYHSSSAGETSSCNKVWVQDLPYLHSVVSPYDNTEDIHKYSPTFVYEATKQMTLENFRKKLQEWVSGKGNYTLQWETDGALPLYAVESDGLNGQYMYKTNYYYVKNNKKVYITGTNLRSIFGLRSHAIDVAYDAESDTLTLVTEGWGHGVGLSQYGAIGYANEEGWSYDRILRHYYSITDDTPYQLVAANW